MGHSEAPLFVQRCISIIESRPECSSKAPPANRPGQPCCSRLRGRRPRSHWSSQTLLPRASGASYPVGGCGEAAGCCESAEQEGEAETAEGNNIQVPITPPSHSFLLVITLGKGMLGKWYVYKS